jgi:hypothetical protein
MTGSSCCLVIIADRALLLPRQSLARRRHNVDNLSPADRQNVSSIQEMFGVDAQTALAIYISLLSDPTYFEMLGIDRPRRR